MAKSNGKPTANGRTDIVSLRHELSKVQQECLLASRKGDFRKVGRLTARAGEISKAILAQIGISFGGK